MRIAETDMLNAAVLVVDDQEANVRLLQQMLQQAGYLHVSVSMNPAEVCALHRRNAYDLILLDLQMAGMDGFQVMEGLKTNAADSYLPVIVITAQPGHKLRALQAGARDFISKPFDLVHTAECRRKCADLHPHAVAEVRHRIGGTRVSRFALEQNAHVRAGSGEAEEARFAGDHVT